MCSFDLEMHPNSAPELTGGTYDAPSSHLVGWGEEHPLAIFTLSTTLSARVFVFVSDSKHWQNWMTSD